MHPFSIDDIKPLTVMTGHYGAGKTNLSIHLARMLAADGAEVTLVDLDIANPYFRTSDVTQTLTAEGITVIAPNFSGTNLEAPSLPPSVDGMLSDITRNPDRGFVILDVGGDDAGAIALGQYAAKIAQVSHECYYAINPFRYLTATTQQAIENLHTIQQVGRVPVTAIINNANLGNETRSEDIISARSTVQALSAQSHLPIAFTAVPSGLQQEFPADVAVDILVGFGRVETYQ